MRISLIALLFGLLTGCSSHFSIADLVGKYELSVDDGIDVIELNANGTYSHTFSAKSGLLDHQEGKWTLEYLQAGPTVVLDDFRSFSAGDAEKPSFYHLSAERWFGDVYLITDIDLNIGYKKTN